MKHIICTVLTIVALVSGSQLKKKICPKTITESEAGKAGNIETNGLKYHSTLQTRFGDLIGIGRARSEIDLRRNLLCEESIQRGDFVYTRLLSHKGVYHIPRVSHHEIFKNSDIKLALTSDRFGWILGKDLYSFLVDMSLMSTRFKTVRSITRGEACSGPVTTPFFRNGRYTVGNKNKKEIRSTATHGLKMHHSFKGDTYPQDNALVPKYSLCFETRRGEREAIMIMRYIFQQEANGDTGTSFSYLGEKTIVETDKAFSDIGPFLYFAEVQTEELSLVNTYLTRECNCRSWYEGEYMETVGVPLMLECGEELTPEIADKQISAGPFTRVLSNDATDLAKLVAEEKTSGEKKDSSGILSNLKLRSKRSIEEETYRQKVHERKMDHFLPEEVCNTLFLEEKIFFNLVYKRCPITGHEVKLGRKVNKIKKLHFEDPKELLTTYGISTKDMRSTEELWKAVDVLMNSTEPHTMNDREEKFNQVSHQVSPQTASTSSILLDLSHQTQRDGTSNVTYQGNPVLHRHRRDVICGVVAALVAGIAICPDPVDTWAREQIGGLNVAFKQVKAAIKDVARQVETKLKAIVTTFTAKINELIDQFNYLRDATAESIEEVRRAIQTTAESLSNRINTVSSNIDVIAEDMELVKDSLYNVQIESAILRIELLSLETQLELEDFESIIDDNSDFLVDNNGCSTVERLPETLIEDSHGSVENIVFNQDIGPLSVNLLTGNEIDTSIDTGEVDKVPDSIQTDSVPWTWVDYLLLFAVLAGIGVFIYFGVKKGWFSKCFSSLKNLTPTGRAMTGLSSLKAGLFGGASKSKHQDTDDVDLEGLPAKGPSHI